MLFFTFIKGGGSPNLNGFLSIIRGGVKSLLTNVNKKMVFFIEGFPNCLNLESKWKHFTGNIYVLRERIDL